MIANMTDLSSAIDASKAKLDGLEQNIVERASKEFE